MKQKVKFSIGSQVFFSSMSGFHSKDEDYLYIMEGYKLKHNIVRFNIEGQDKFLCRDMTKEEFLNDTMQSDLPMKIGKFFAPEFAKYLGLTINDLKRLKPILDDIDDAHLYYKDIYDAYMENQAFILTDEQRLKAYETYKKVRNI